PGHGTTARIVSGPPQAESSARPLERRAFRMARPARVRIRARKPCFLALRRLFGWNVRLLMVLLDRGHGRAPRGGLWSAARTGSPGAPAGTGRLPRSDPMPEGVLSGSGNRIGTARSADCTILGTGLHGVNASAFLRPGCGRILTRPGPPASPDAPDATPPGWAARRGGPRHVLSTSSIHNTGAIVENCPDRPLDLEGVT